MAYNNTVVLTGNIGSEAKILTGKNNKEFAAVSIATADSYQDENGSWVQKDSVWHNVLIFSPRLVEQIKALKTGTRITVTGSLSYRPFEVQINGQTVTKKEASVIAGKIEQAPLYKKSA